MTVQSQKKYTEIKEWISNLDDCVEMLQKITGKNKKDFDKAQEEWREKTRIESELVEKAAKENIPNWIERGHKIFSEDKWEEWDKIVPIRAEDLYHGMELDNTLQIQEILSSKYSEESFEKAKKCMEEQGHSGMSWSLVCAMVKEFCTNGKEFLDYLENKEKETEEENELE